MWAWVHIDGDKTSEWVDVTQGLPQGCVIAPHLLSIFFAVVLTVVFGGLSIDQAAVDDFVHIVVRNEETRDELSKVFWAIRYAQVAGIASRSQLS